MMTFNESIYFNIKYLAKKNNMLLGDIEKSVGLRKGYFSVKSRNDESAIPLEKVYLIAQIFQVSMDEMCSNIPLKELEETAKEFGYMLVPIGEEENENTSRYALHGYDSCGNSRKSDSDAEALQGC